jgi:hypothetical protein
MPPRFLPWNVKAPLDDPVKTHMMPATEMMG